jgi:hypothetical protein
LAISEEQAILATDYHALVESKLRTNVARQPIWAEMKLTPCSEGRHHHHEEKKKKKKKKKKKIPPHKNIGHAFKSRALSFLSEHTQISGNATRVAAAAAAAGQLRDHICHLSHSLRGRKVVILE